ncbi:MAG: ABC transporter permease [Acidobacteriota bacterium]
MFWRGKFEREMDAELRHHLALLEAEYVQRGMSPEEALLAAKRDFGSVAKTAEAYREQRGIPWMETVWRDMRMALRSMLRAKALAVAIIVTLALGIGANTAIFSVIRTVQFKPLPYPDSERLVWVTANGSPEQTEGWRKTTQAYDALASVVQRDATLYDGPEPLELNAIYVSQPLSRVLGVKIALGRDFLEEEVAQTMGRSGSQEIALISYRLFQERYAGDPQMVGRSVSMQGRIFFVVGVLSPDFRLPLPRGDRNVEPDIIINAGVMRGSIPYWIGRLKPNVSPQAAEGELAGVFQDKTKPSRVVTLQEHIIGRTRVELLVLWFAVSCVLLIACVNVANLLLARSTTRAREIAVKAALGASRFALIRQTLAETTLLSFCGGGLGLVLASTMVELISNKGPIDVPRLREVSLDGWVVAYGALCCVLTALLSGLGPALTATRQGLLSALRRGEGNSSASWKVRLWHRGLAGGQIAVALVLLIGAGLLVKTLWVMRSPSLDVEPERVLISRIQTTLPYPRLSAKAPEDLERQVRLESDRRSEMYDGFMRTVGQVPGVRQAALSITASLYTRGTRVVGAPVNWQVPPGMPISWVTPGYFAAAGHRLSAGRWFDERDSQNAPSVVIVNEAFLRTYAPGMSAREVLDRTMEIANPSIKTKPIIVGVVHDLSLRRDVAPEPQMFFAQSQNVSFYATPELILRAAGDPAPLIGTLRKLADASSIQMFQPQTLEERISAATATRDFEAQLLTTFAGVALLLAVVGVYGVLNYAVSQRTHEIGVRMALGADRTGVLMTVLRDGMVLAVVGTAIGVAGAFGLTRWMGSMLYGVQARDPWIFGGGCALMMVVAGAAAYWPARRATRVDPMVALRHE